MNWKRQPAPSNHPMRRHERRQRKARNEDSMQDIETKYLDLERNEDDECAEQMSDEFERRLGYRR